MIRRAVGKTLECGNDAEHPVTAKIVMRNDSRIRYTPVVIEIEQGDQKVVLTEIALATILQWANGCSKRIVRR